MPAWLTRWRAWIAGRRRPPSGPDPSFAYRVGWLNEARTWDAARRAAVSAGLRAIVEDPSFTPNENRRRYRVPELDSRLHAGASLLALQQILQAIESES